MSKINLKFKKSPDRSHEIIIESGILKKLDFYLKEFSGKQIAIICDANVKKLYGLSLQKIFNGKKFRVRLISFSAGETNKNLNTVESVLNQLSRSKINRNDLIIALGGGVTGDLAGFIASIYMRGISLILIPTTLLAMCDSSIGGKNGVDLITGKNLAGTIYQPKKIIIDPEVIKTLSAAEMQNGFAEIIKSALIYNPKLFSYLEKNLNRLKNLDIKFLTNLIFETCKIKRAIVTQDETEQGLRKTLNYGHTIGHAIEKLTNYKISHGQAVVIGIRLINTICTKKLLLNKQVEKQVSVLLNKFGFDSKLAKKFTSKQNLEKIWQLMAYDKKVKNNKINFIGISKIGHAFITDKITKADFLNLSKTF